MSIQVLIVGETASGKSASLMNLTDQENWYYANFENGRPLPFSSKIKKANLIDPYQLTNVINAVKSDPNAKGLVIDSLTYMMNAFESIHVINSVDTRDSWGSYQQFFQNLMSKELSVLKAPVVFLAQTDETVDQFGNISKIVPIKGALKKVGIESFFSFIIAAKKLNLTDLAKYSSEFLNITEDDKEVGYKHVFQTRPTKETVGDRIRSPIGMWSKQETFIDNNLQFVIDRLQQYYS